MQIYIHRNGRQFGPYSIEEARKYLASGDLQADDFAWHEGAPDWIPLSKIKIVSGSVPPRPARPVTATAHVAAAVKTSAEVSDQKSQPEWIPPRRLSAPSPLGALPARIIGNSPAKMARPERRKRTLLPELVPDESESPDAPPRISPSEFRTAIRYLYFGGLSCFIGIGAIIFSCQMGSTYQVAAICICSGGTTLFGAYLFGKGLILLSK